MNQKNVNALAKIFEKYSDALIDPAYAHPKRWAMTLAKEGVLVPSALTHDQAWTLVDSVNGGTHTSGEALRTITEQLEKIARGDNG